MTTEGGVVGEGLLDHSSIERMLLSGFLLHPERLEEVNSLLKPSHFSTCYNQTIYSAMLGLYIGGSPIDLVHLSQALRTDPSIDISSLAEALSGTPAPKNKAYAWLVIKNSKRRELAEHLRIQAEAAENGAEPSKIIAMVDSLLSDVSGSEAPDFYTSKTLSDRVWAQIQEEKASPGARRAVSSGFRALDDMLAGGFRPGELAIVAGRPAMGKTAFAVNIAANMAKNGFPCLIFSLEMTAESLQRRLAQVVCQINRDVLDPRNLADETRAKKALDTVGALPIVINDMSSLSTPFIHRVTAAAVRKAGVKCVFIDYLQLVRGPNPSDMREREIALISSSFKALAKEFKIPVIAASQLNRQVEMRETKRPLMSDLRESGSIEQDADIVLLMYRDDYYNPNPTAKTGETEIILGKHRNGPTGTVYLQFEDSQTRFYEKNELTSSPSQLVSNNAEEEGGLVF